MIYSCYTKIHVIMRSVIKVVLGVTIEAKKDYCHSIDIAGRTVSMRRFF